MKTPIFDFVQKYAENNNTRFHIPGHKGTSILGIEAIDITEFDGADSLYEVNGIIKESESNASLIFGSNTFYSTEGSSQCIRALIHLATMNANKDAPILAGRNCHKTFLSAVALLNINVEWIESDCDENFLSCSINSETINKQINNSKVKPCAVYITSPDYLGNVADIKSISDVCHINNVLLIVDNAHGAYLKFLPQSKHPIDLGADICCDSAHKTLPALTGAAYLHISNNAPKYLIDNAKNSLALFGSTSPSYLILQSLDLLNKYLIDYPRVLNDFIKSVDNVKLSLIEMGFTLYGNEELKITINAKEYGYYGYELADILFNAGIVCEFSDPDYLVLMLTPEITNNQLSKLVTVLKSIAKKPKITNLAPKSVIAKRKMSIRQAMLSKSESVNVEQALGRVLASASVGCPPAVPILISGEVIDQKSIEAFKYYGITTVSIVSQ